MRFKIDVRGIVQGVGFRPFIYNLAHRLKLTGHIFNNKLGVTIEIQGNTVCCDKFTRCLSSELPPLARVSDINSSTITFIKDEKSFRILHSKDDSDDIALISPDNDVCPDCLKEIFDPEDRRFRYPFINCTNCGPRYTLIRKTPYDRPFTSMSEFKMCPDCQSEYDDHENRRFHAQPNACPECGPSIKLLDTCGKEIKSNDPIDDTINFVKKGRIIAIKGIGGYHLVCDATDEQSVSELRKRKLRKEKPFAIMSKDVEAIKTYACVNDMEEKLLQSREKPIVLLKKKINSLLAEPIAPGFTEYGAFLPCTPIQHLLFSGNVPVALVMTSGNISEEPIVFDEKEVFERLGGIADFYLINDRPIVWRCDDSIVRVVQSKNIPLNKGGHGVVDQAQYKTMISRRSRGWVPAPIFIEEKVPPMIACGGDLKNVFCLAKGRTVFPGPHIGDLENSEALRSFKESIDHFKKIFEIEPELITVDRHPNYFSSRYGRSLGLPVTEVQHHHSHIVSVMAENKLNDKVIGLALDGTGYGDDGTIWGGEILICDRKSYKRWGHFPQLKLPGGDKAAKEPWRTAVAVLYDIYGDNLFDMHPQFVKTTGEKNIRNIIQMIKADVNCPVSTGAGRWFDAVSSILLIQHYNDFEGQSPILLEAKADLSVEKKFDFAIDDNGTFDFREIIKELVEMAGTEADKAKGSAMFHNTIARALLSACMRIKEETGLSRVCLGGGTFQNVLLLTRLSSMLLEKGFKVYLPNQLPINDGGLALGQLVIAASTE